MRDEWWHRHDEWCEDGRGAYQLARRVQPWAAFDVPDMKPRSLVTPPLIVVAVVMAVGVGAAVVHRASRPEAGRVVDML